MRLRSEFPAHSSLARMAYQNMHTGIASARLQISTALKTPGKWHLLEEQGYSYLPYHPTYLPAKTSLAAPLVQPLSFGTAEREQSIAATLTRRLRIALWLPA